MLLSQVTAFDFSPEAVQQAEERLATSRKAGQPATATFVVADALDLGTTFGDRQFDTVLDSALFHVFSDDHRHSYIRSLTPLVRTLQALHVHDLMLQHHQSCGAD